MVKEEYEILKTDPLEFMKEQKRDMMKGSGENGTNNQPDALGETGGVNTDDGIINMHERMFGGMHRGVTMEGDQ